MDMVDEMIGGGIPDGNHISMVIDGIIDTVAGNEGHSLTEAQQYLAGVMYASGSVSFTDYHGCENIVDSIKKGFQAAWDYIVKMIKSIWDFFFKSKAKQEAANATAAIIRLEEFNKLRPSSSQDRRQLVKEIVRAGAKFSHMNLDKTDPRQKNIIEQQIEVLKEKADEMETVDKTDSVKEAKVVEDVKKEFQKLAGEVCSVNMNGVVKKANDALESLRINHQTIHELEKSEARELNSDWMFYIRVALGVTIKAIDPVPLVLRGFTVSTQAGEVVSKLKSCVKQIESGVKDFAAMEKGVKGHLAELQKAAKENPEDKKVQDGLKLIRLGLKICAESAEIISWYLRIIAKHCEYWSVRI